ncbi:MAG: hypothetical protein IJZ95_00025 [Oscillospiraceae bacterium]|nr:hypothetical protein [Oscillospiraceae bacterium]
MKKIILSAAAAAISLVFSGCIATMPEGYDKVRAAKDKYETLDSARATMTDLTTGEKIMEFSFYINSNDEMILSYYGKDGDNEMYAYSDGAEYFYKENGAELWSVISSADENYIYNVYNRDYRYPYADGGIFFLDGGSVETAVVDENSDGSCIITYTYNADKLNESTKGILEDVSSFASLSTEFKIDNNGYITAFTETGTVTASDGTTREVDMKISIDMMNEVYEIPYPVDRVDKAGQN